MKVCESQGDKLRVELSREELGLIGNALNEVCNGVHIDDFEFQTRLSVPRAELQRLLNQIAEAYRSGSV